MNKIMLMSLLMLLSMPFLASAASLDFYVLEVINISQSVVNPAALETIPGGFLVVDWNGTDNKGLIMDGQGRLKNLTNLSDDLSNRITGVRVFNYTGSELTVIFLDDTGKRILRANITNLTRYGKTEWFGISPGNFSSTDELAGMCTNTSFIWTATANRDVVSVLDGPNSSRNESEFAIVGTNAVGGLDCEGKNNSNFYILDDLTSYVYITSNQTIIEDSVNLSNITGGQGANSFSDIAFLSKFDFYVLNNATKVIYHIRKRAGLDQFAPNITFTYPNNLQTFSTRFSSILIQINFSARQVNDTLNRSLFKEGDVINCSLFVNNTYNSTINIGGLESVEHNISLNKTMNLTFTAGADYRLRIECKANITYAAKAVSPEKTIYVRSFKHIFFAGDNFSLYYNSDTLAFEAALGNSTPVLSAPFNITTGSPIAIKISWKNSTKNRTMYIDGVHKTSDLAFENAEGRKTRIYLGSRNDTGQMNGIISYFQTSNKAASDMNYRKGNFITSWTEKVKDLRERFSTSSRFWQLRATLRRSLTSENPTLYFVNVSFDNTLFNKSLPSGINFLDFKFSSASSSAIPAGQTDTVPAFVIWNRGNTSFELRAFSLTNFDSCFTVRLYNQSDTLLPGAQNNTINLSATPRNTTQSLGPGKNASIWINVTASGCGLDSEFFDLEFDTFP